MNIEDYSNCLGKSFIAVYLNLEDLKPDFVKIHILDSKAKRPYREYGIFLTGLKSLFDLAGGVDGIDLLSAVVTEIRQDALGMIHLELEAFSFSYTAKREMRYERKKRK